MNMSKTSWPLGLVSNGKNAFSRAIAVMTAIVLQLTTITASGAQTPSSEPFTRLFDTSVASSEPLAPSAMDARRGWTQIPEDQTQHEFAGDVVLLNDRLALVLRRNRAGVEVYARTSSGFRMHGALAPLGEASANEFKSVRIIENAPSGVTIEASFDSMNATPLGLLIELLQGQLSVKTQASNGTKALSVKAPCEFAVLPDFFADDIVIDPAQVSVDTLETPSENFLLHLLDSGNAVVMNVWDNRDQDVRVHVDHVAKPAKITSTEIEFGDKGSIWIAVMTAPGVWHKRGVLKSERGRILPLDWSMPFPAVWRVDWRRADQLTDSWEMAVENQDGSFRKSELFEVSKDAWTDRDWWASEKPRWRWNTGLGSYWYPCWIDRNGRAFLQPLSKRRSFVGPALVYAINRSADTPLDMFTVTDIVRNTLGMGPCQYILDVEGHKSNFKGRPTCDVRDTLNAIYEKGEHRSKSAEVTQALDNVLAFMRLIRGRIEQYAQFAREIQVYLEQQRATKAAPEAFLDEMLKQARRVDEAIVERKEGLKTPEYATALVEKFRTTLVGYSGADAAGRCREITAGFVGIGENQDELVAECRQCVKLLRQRAVLAMAQDPNVSDVVKEIRARTQTMLRDPVNYEAAAH